MQVKIYHNCSIQKYMEGYRDGDPLVLGLELDINVASDIGVCEWAFNVLNAPENALDTWEQTIAGIWRAQQIPSLSVGDVVEVMGKRWSADHTGWQEVN